MSEKHRDVGTLKAGAITVARGHFMYVLIYTLSIVAFDAWKLITPDVLLIRWTLAASMLVVVAGIWYVMKKGASKPSHYKFLIGVLILFDIFLASINLYLERGMASRSVMLFAIPIVVSAVLKSRTALLATATFCTAAYALTAVRYFVINPSEGYKVELYGVIGFYCAIFFVIARTLAFIVDPKRYKD